MQSRTSSAVQNESFARQVRAKGLASEDSPRKWSKAGELFEQPSQIPPVPTLEEPGALPETRAALPGGQEEAVVLREGRSPLLICGDRIEIPRSGIWVQPLLPAGALIGPPLRSVSRVEIGRGRRVKMKRLLCLLLLTTLPTAWTALIWGADVSELKAPNDWTPPPVHVNQWYRLDDLEAFRNEYGTITIKQPDVWGQARIMQHRAEFENVMAAQLTNFALTFQGSRSFSKQTSFANALGVSAGLGGTVPVLTGNPTNAGSTTAALPTNTVLNLVSNILFQNVPIPANNVQTFGPNATISLDPVVALDQQANYITHLQHLRRINEGDDTADSAGYSLYLLRMPVSVDPGLKTQKGYGAELRVQVLSEDLTNLLAITIPKLVINDLALQLSQALTPLVNATNLPEFYKTVTNALADSSTFSPGDIRDLSTFEEQLSPRSQGIYKYIYNNLSSNTRDMLGRLPDDTKMRQALVNDLNRIIRGVCPLPLTSDDILNLEPFAARLKKSADPIARYVKSNLPKATSELLTAYSGGSSSPLQQALATALNDLVSKDLLYDPRRFVGVKLSPETANLLRQNPEGGSADLVWLNRLLLADAFPGDLPQDQALYDPALFAGTALSGETLTLLRQNLQGTNLLRLNRLLLIDACPGMLSRTLFAGVDSPAAKLFLWRAAASQAAIDYTNTLQLLATFTDVDTTSQASDALARKTKWEDYFQQVDRAFDKMQEIEGLLQQFSTKLSSARFTRSPFAFPNNQIANVYGVADVVLLAERIHDDLGGDPNNTISNLELQKYLIENLEVAYTVLKARREEFQSACAPLPSLFRRLELDDLKDIQYAVTSKFSDNTNSDSVTPLLVWPTVIESALLEDRLLGKMGDEAKDLDNSTDPLLLQPSPAVEKAFRDYVRRRWPTHAFALDPVAQQQNIADTSSFRDNLQLSLSFALATGKLNVSDYANYSQRLGLDLDAILLNHTVTAFADGDDTFGWHFFPRFSTKRDPKDWSLDRGMRECTALLILPSFVPQITLQTRTRWFDLASPSKTEPTIETMYYLSERWEKMRIKYRDSFLLSLENTRVEALAKQLNDPSNSVSTYLRTSLSPATSTFLSQYRGAKLDWALRANLLDDLNRIIVRGPIYDSVRFTNVALSPETRKVLWENPQYGLDLSYLNRLLLQDTYPHEIAKESRFSRDNTPYLRADRDQGMQFLDQLKSALPLQTRSVPLPYETAVGGFTLFNAEGISFLGPDLYGYQGNAVTDGTNDFTVYLVGNNFSVRGTRVLASGAQLNNSVLLSRQLIAATVPGPLIAQAKQVEITVATPYGVSSPITVKPTFTGKATPQTPKTGYTWQVNATNTTSYGIQIFVLTNHVALPTLLANAQDPYPHITRTLSTGTDAVLQPESAALAFKVSVVTDSGEAVIANTNNSSVLQITEGGKLKMFQFANNEMLSPANFCEMVWPQLTNYIGNKLDHYYVSNSLAANVKIKLGTYLRLDTGAVIQTDDPLLLPLSQ